MNTQVISEITDVNRIKHKLEVGQVAMAARVLIASAFILVSLLQA